MSPTERPASQDPDPDLVDELAFQSLARIRELRRYERVEARLSVRVEAGNRSDRGRFESTGTTKDISRGGCRVLLDNPPAIGDVYRLHIQLEPGSEPMVFARCLRCSLVREDAFDASFSFFAPFDVPSRKPSEDLDGPLA